MKPYQSGWQPHEGGESNLKPDNPDERKTQRGSSEKKHEYAILILHTVSACILYGNGKTFTVCPSGFSHVVCLSSWLFGVFLENEKRCTRMLWIINIILWMRWGLIYHHMLCANRWRSSDLKTVTFPWATLSCTCGTAKIRAIHVDLEDNMGKVGLKLTFCITPLQFRCQLFFKLARQPSCRLLLPLSHSPLNLPELHVFGLQLFAKRCCSSSFSSSITHMSPIQTA